MERTSRFTTGDEVYEPPALVELGRFATDTLGFGKLDPDGTIQQGMFHGATTPEAD